MAVRSMGVSEARRLLPQLVRTIADEGGRIDVTLRGEPRVSIVRTEDVAGGRTRRRKTSLPEAARVEFLFPSEDLIDVIRDLRSRVGRPRRVALRSRKPRRPTRRTRT